MTMKFGVYCVYDKKGLNYGTPFFLNNDVVAVRTFGDLVNDSKTTIWKHPEDYDVVRIGEYIDTGELIPCKVNTLANGMKFRKEQNAPIDLGQIPLDALTKK